MLPLAANAMVTSPNTTSQKNSGGPKAYTTGFTTGRRARSMTAPPREPTKQAVADTARARAPSPLRVMG